MKIVFRKVNVQSARLSITCPSNLLSLYTWRRRKDICIAILFESEGTLVIFLIKLWFWKKNININNKMYNFIRNNINYVKDCYVDIHNIFASKMHISNDYTNF